MSKPLTHGEHIWKETDKTVEHMGQHVMWGFSPAVDLLDSPCKDGPMEDGNEEPLNILLVQPGDVRHIIKTIASRRCEEKFRFIYVERLYTLDVCYFSASLIRVLCVVFFSALRASRRHSKRALNFFIFDKPIECVARHLLLLQVCAQMTNHYTRCLF